VLDIVFKQMLSGRWFTLGSKRYATFITVTILAFATMNIAYTAIFESAMQ